MEYRQRHEIQAGGHRRDERHVGVADQQLRAAREREVNQINSTAPIEIIRNEQQFQRQIHRHQRYVEIGQLRENESAKRKRYCPLQCRDRLELIGAS
jgi:hypothetical protein